MRNCPALWIDCVPENSLMYVHAREGRSIETSTFFFLPSCHYPLVWPSSRKIMTEISAVVLPRVTWDLKPLQGNGGSNTFLSLLEFLSINSCHRDLLYTCERRRLLSVWISSNRNNHCSCGHLTQIENNALASFNPWKPLRQVNGLETSCIPRRSTDLFSTVCWPLQCLSAHICFCSDVEYLCWIRLRVEVL